MVSLRATFNAGLDLVLGDDSHELPAIPPDVPERIVPVVQEAVASLVEYQNAAYAELYLTRLRRFTKRRTIHSDLLLEIARLLAIRMSYNDPIRLAQLRVSEVLHAGYQKKGQKPEAIRFPLEDIVSILPEAAAEGAVVALGLFGWSNLRMPLRFTARTRAGLIKLKAMALLRRLRLQSLRYPRESALVERWLHMIDRSLAKYPDAALEVARTASMIRGSGDVYQRSVAGWHLMIDNLVKPVLYGQISLPDLGPAVARVRAAAEGGADHEGLRQLIDEIKSSQERQVGSVTQN